MTRWLGWALGLEAAFLGMRLVSDIRTHAIAFLLLFAAAFGCFLVVAHLLLSRHVEFELSLPQVLWFVGLTGLFFRLTLLPLTPTLSDDIYRYLWDGRVQLAGVNPYAYAPDAPELMRLRTDEFASINHPSIPTIYPPLTQLAF